MTRPPTTTYRTICAWCGRDLGPAPAAPANARFDAALLKLLDKHEAVHAATTPMERHLAITIRNDAMMSVEMMFEAEHAECKRLRAQLEEVTR